MTAAAAVASRKGFKKNDMGFGKNFNRDIVITYYTADSGDREKM